MLGWDLSRVDLRSPGASTVVGVINYGAAGTSNSALVAISDYIGCGSGGILGSSISTTCGTSCPSISTPGRLKFPSISIYGISTSFSSDSAPTPGISTFPMRRPCLSVKVNCFSWSLPNLLMQ